MAAAGLTTYLAGGTPPGGSRHRAGARDHTPPAADVPVELPHRLRFAGSSHAWNGTSVAYLERDHGATPTLARAWLLTAEQFDDLVAQESHRPVTTDPPTTSVDLDTLLARGRVDVDGGHYDDVLLVGTHDGYPIATCTTPDVPAPGPPSRAYLALVATGLAEGWGLDLDAISRYLCAQTGIVGCRDGREVRDAIAAALGDGARPERGSGTPTAGP